MNLENNPFKYDAANNLTDKMIADYYIDDFNYSRFIQSKRNIFLVGERGSGKTMALLFNSWRIQKGHYRSLPTLRRALQKDLKLDTDWQDALAAD